MMQCTTKRVMMTLVVLLGCAGCQYNGALTMEPRGSASQQQKLAELKRTLAEQRAAARQSQQTIAFGRGAAAAAMTETLDGEHQQVTVPRTHPTASMSLYGQLPQTTVAISSPLDSPENVSRVTFTVEGADFDPDIDPSGQWLAFASTQHRDTADIYIKRIDGTAVTQLTQDPANDVMPAFSSDGKSVAFASDRSGNWDIYLMDVAGGQATQLTSSSTHDIHPSFSPDGKQLVYCQYGEQSGQWELVVIDVMNPATKRIIANGLFPSWSPTDNRIVYQRARQRGTRWFSIWTIELINGEATPPTEVAASSNAAVITPDWSPDGKRVVFCTVISPQADNTAAGLAGVSASSDKPIRADVWMMQADGSSRTNLTSSRFASLQPAWAPDGSIFFVSNRGVGGVENVWAIRPDRALRVVNRSQGVPDGAFADQQRPAAGEGDSAAMVPTQ